MAAGLALQASAQESTDEYVSEDEGTRTVGAVWTEVGATKLLPYNLTLGIDAGFRSDEWFRSADRFDVAVGLSWKPSKHWKFGVGYTFISKHYGSETEHKSNTEVKYKYNGLSTDPASFLGAPFYTDDNGTKYAYDGYNESYRTYTRVTGSYWRAKHRLSADASYTHKIFGFLRLTLRERYQLTFVPVKTVNRTRNRIKTTTKYRDPYYPDGSTLDGYDSYTNLWQTGDVIYSEEFRDDDGDRIYDSQGVQDVTASYLADHENEGLNTVVEQEKDKSSKTLQVLRSRLTFEIDKKGWNWTPYVYVELFNNMGENMHMDKVRASLGVDYSLTKRHKIGVGYIFNHENDDDGDVNIHAISIGYKFKF